MLEHRVLRFLGTADLPAFEGWSPNSSTQMGKTVVSANVSPLLMQGHLLRMPKAVD